ncbi:MAG: hypothetical protein RSD40_04480, partial [Bacilli bacterium]
YSNAYSTYQQLSKNPKSITLQLKEKDCAEIPEQEKVIILKIEIMINKLEEYTANVFGKLDKFLNHDNKQTTKTFADSLIKNISFSTKFSDLAFLKNINTYIHINNNDESTIREKKAFSNVNLKDLQVVANLSLLLNKTSTEIANRMKIESQKPNNTLELQKKNKDDKLTIKINKSVNSAKHFNMLVKDFQELDLGFSKDCLELDKKICLKDSFDMITNYYKNVTDPTKIKDVFKSIKNSFDVRDSIYQEKPIIKKLITASTENLTTLETKISTELTRDEELEVSFANAIGESENIIQLSKHMQDIQIFTQDIYNVIVQISKIDVDLKVLSSLYLELGNDKIAIPDSIINCVKNILANKVQEITNNLNEDLRCSNRNHVPINIINEYKKNVNIEIDKSKQHIKTINKLVSSLSNISKEINSTYKEYQTSPIILCVNKQKDEEQSQQDFADSAKLMQALYNCFSNDNDVVAKDIADERTDNSLQELINSLSSGITGGQVFANTLKLKTKTFRKLIEKLNELVAETTQSMLDSDPNLYIDKIFEKLKKLPIYSTPYNFDELYIYLNKEEVKTRFIPEYYDTQNIINSYLKESSPYNFLLNTLCAYKEIESKKLDDLIPKITDLSSKELNEILTKLFEILIEKNKCTKHVLEENIQYFVNRIIELIEIKNKEQLQTFKNKTFNSPLNNPQSSNSDDNMEDLNQKIGDYRLKGLIQLSLCKDNNLFQSIDDKDTEIQEIQEPQEEIQETNSQSE